jgi:hypothetical protein
MQDQPVDRKDQPDPNNPLVNKLQFKHRRRMAYISLFGIFFLIMFAVFKIPAVSMPVYENILMAGIYTFTAVILTYMGSTSWVASIFMKTGGNNDGGGRGGNPPNWNVKSGVG